MTSNLALNVLRAVFILVAGALAVFIIKSWPGWFAQEGWRTFVVFGACMVVAVGVIALDMVLREKRLDSISSVYFGLLVGLFLTYVASFAIDPFIDLMTGPIAPGQPKPLHQVVNLGMGIVVCYVCVSFLIQTRNDFRFIIPYVEFSKEVKGLKPYVLDTSVVIDGRIADVVEAGLLDSQLILPRFALTELQSVADSSDKLRRGRGRRGLDILNKLRSEGKVDLQIYDRDLPEFAGQSVDLKLVLLAKHLDGKIVTNDYNLNKVARLHGVGVINLNDLANALKPVCLPGESLTVSLVKPGEDPSQGVGYLEDGTMVVVEGGRDHLNQTVEITVTSVLQKSAGRMIFGRFEQERRAVAKPV